MLIRNLIVVAVFALLAWGGISIYRYFSSSIDTVDSRLADMTMKEIEFQKERFGDHVISFDPLGDGEFNMVIKGIENGQDAGRLGYNALAVLDGQNIKINTPRNVFKIHGYQDDVLIFTIVYITNAKPEITLHGPFEDVEYEPSFSWNPPSREDSENPAVTSYA